MRRASIALVVILVVTFVTSIFSFAQVVCIGKGRGYVRFVNSCDDCKRLETCDCVVPGNQKCPQGSFATGFDEDCNIICEGQSTVDSDGDGFISICDCDDNDPDIYPCADEVCDEIDNDCDGQVDEGLSVHHTNFLVHGGSQVAEYHTSDGVYVYSAATALLPPFDQILIIMDPDLWLPGSPEGQSFSIPEPPGDLIVMLEQNYGTPDKKSFVAYSGELSIEAFGGEAQEFRGYLYNVELFEVTFDDMGVPHKVPCGDTWTIEGFYFRVSVGW